MDKSHILGNLPSTVHKPLSYFLERYCFVDCRGKLVFPASSDCGYGVKFLTASHDIGEGRMGVMVTRAVVLGEYDWIGSFSILYNCKLGDGVVVSTGSVVSGVQIPDHCLVQGNPAMIVATYIEDMQKWHRCDPIKPEEWKHK